MTAFFFFNLVITEVFWKSKSVTAMIGRGGVRKVKQGQVTASAASDLLEMLRQLFSQGVLQLEFLKEPFLAALS